jgi:hypothetical protein
LLFLNIPALKYRVKWFTNILQTKAINFNNGEGKMPHNKMLSISNIAKELNSGKATIKFLLKRFNKWLPFELVDGQAHYSNTCIKKIILIQENLDAGALPADIEKQLDALPDKDSLHSASNNLLDTFASPSQNGDIRLSNDGLVLLKSLIADIGEQQKKIAKAHEKRADAEEKKAVAIEKRAGAEEKKAQAMNNIANALQEMNKLRGSDPEALQIAHEAVSVIAIDNDENYDFKDDTENVHDENQDIQTDIKPDIQPNIQPNIKIDDLSLLVEDELNIGVTKDSLSETDDLSLLLDNDIESEDTQPLDNLSELIDTPLDTEQPAKDIDDLSMLIDEKPDDQSEPEQLDDLSLLIDSVSSDSQGDQIKHEQTAGLDDLSKLIEKPSNHGQPEANIDDLSKLIEETPEIKIDFTPEEDLRKYKAAVMKIIIELKTKGLDIEETTNRLNTSSIKTLSGKPEWSQKAIAQIYKFIESA